MTGRAVQQRLLAIAMFLLASAIVGACWSDHPIHSRVFFSNAVISITIAGTLAVIAVILLASSFDMDHSPTWMRLDWFVPMLRRDTPGKHSPRPLRWLRGVLPTSWFSDRVTKRRGSVRRVLRWFGLASLASPVRRLSQAFCLVAFLALFLYVCWPYDARPAGPGRASNDWWFTSLDQTSGEFELLQRTPTLLDDPAWLQVEQTVFVTQVVDHVICEMQVSRIGNGRIWLLPTGEFSDDAFDAFLTSSAAFTMREDDPHAWPSHYADNLAAKESIPVDVFLVIDPLVSLSTAVASRSWVWSLLCAAAILIACVVIPRGFCGYVCPLGTTIDLFDWLIGKRVKRFRVGDDGWWVHLKYYLLGGTMVAAACGVLISGFVSAIPVMTRAMLFMVDPMQSGFIRGWHSVPSFHGGHVISIAMFAAVLSLGWMRPRFWCKYVCPSGAVFSLGNLLRVTERKVESSCIHCNKCVEICPFDAIKPDFTTRTTDCTMCQSCGGVCPTHAIKFVERWNVFELKVVDEPPTQETPLGRRGFLSAAAGTAAATIGGVGIAAATKSFGANLSDPNSFRPVRPPGSVPEQEFLEMCIRCGECFKACPNNVLQPEGFQQGLEGLWTPLVNADWAGCESSCNACGQVCPTGAIRALPLAEKKVARMGLAIVNETTCLPFAGTEACDLCVQECLAAGYDAIEYTQVGVEVDNDGTPVEGSGFAAPVVLADKCVGCGLCQTRCHAINVKEKGMLSSSAIVIEAGEGKEDRMMIGSYLDL